MIDPTSPSTSCVSLDGPQLDLLRQTSLAEEVISKDGIQRRVHAVVKNAPFDVFIRGVSPAHPIDLTTVALHVTLLYDTADLKPVHYLTTQPVEFKPEISSDGAHAKLTCRIKPLSSQHEGSYFRIMVDALEPHSRAPFNPPLKVISAPIRVISKPEQVKGRKKRSAPKKSAMAKLKEDVARLEAQHQEHERLIRMLMADRAPSSSSILQQRVDDDGGGRVAAEVPCSSSLPIASPESPVASGSKLTRPRGGVDDEEDAAAFEFAGALDKLLQAYRAFPPSTRPSKVRRIVRHRHAVVDKELLEEFVDLVATEALDRPLGAPVQLFKDSSSSFSAPFGGPHKNDFDVFGDMSGFL